MINFVCSFLIRIILESAYSLHDRVFMDNIGTILVFAVIVSTCFFL